MTHWITIAAGVFVSFFGWGLENYTLKNTKKKKPCCPSEFFLVKDISWGLRISLKCDPNLNPRCADAKRPGG